MVYQPMIELLGLLDANGFASWIFSGGGADFMRVWAPDVFGVPPHRVIGRERTPYWVSGVNCGYATEQYMKQFESPHA